MNDRGQSGEVPEGEYPEVFRSDLFEADFELTDRSLEGPG